MWNEEMTRTCILGGLRAGRTAKEIIDFFGFPKATVYRVVKNYQEKPEEEREDITPKMKQQLPRSDMKRTREFLDDVMAAIEDSPATNITDLAKRFKTSYRTMWRAVTEDLRYKSYKLQIRQLLTGPMKKKRVERSRILISQMKKGRVIKFFSDEKKFVVDRCINRQTDRWLARDPDDVPVVMKTKNPSSVMCLAVISSAGDVMPPHFFRAKETVTKEVYLAVLKEKLVPWMVEVSAREPFVFQQNGAPAHTSNLVQDWLRENLTRQGSFWPKEFWPPSSPDLNPCDYFLWGVLERKVHATHHPNLDSLRVSITENMADLDEDLVKKACSRFRPRLEAVIAAEGGYFE